MEAYIISFPQGYSVIVTKEFALDTPSATLLDLMNYLLTKTTVPYGAKSVKVDGGKGDGKLLELPIHWEKQWPGPTKYKTPHDKIIELILPGIRNLWHKETGGWVDTIEYHPSHSDYRVIVEGNVVASFGVNLVEDDEYGTIQKIVANAAVKWKHDKNALKLAQYASQYGAQPMKLSDLNKSNQGFLQQLGGGLGSGLGQLGGMALQGLLGNQQPAAKQQDLLKQLMQQQPQAQEIAKLQAEQQAMLAQGFANQSIKPAKPIKELHVYDMGEGMLVPCELAKELAAWMNLPSSTSKHQQDDFFAVASTKMSPKDKLYNMFKKYGLNPEDYIALQEQPKAMLVMPAPEVPLGEIYPGKVMEVDAPSIKVVESPYMTDKNAWFLTDDDKIIEFDWAKEEAQIINAISSQNLGQKYGKKLELLPPDTGVKIPKNPKQVTKQTLEHFHQLLGGKKNPF